MGWRNIQADNLSRMRIAKFKQLALPEKSAYPDPLLDELWPASKIWMD